MVKAQRFVYAKRFEGEPKVSDFRLESEELDDIKDGEVLVKAEYLSVDPYMRVSMDRQPVGVTMVGGQVAEVLESNNMNFPVGAYIFGQLGWRTHTIFNPDNERSTTIPPYVLPDFGEHPRSLALGLLGMPGLTALYGYKSICRANTGDVVVITAAAGAIGSIVGQLAKADGCTVIGLTGDDAKCNWIKSLGFDHAINYKTNNITNALKSTAPDGVDCYFDNVGGKITSIILEHMREYGRIAVCGSISAYNKNPNELDLLPMVQPMFVSKQLVMEGMQAWCWVDRLPDGISTLYELVKSGKIKYEESITEGFTKLPEAFIDMLRGGNIGKSIVKV